MTAAARLLSAWLACLVVLALALPVGLRAGTGVTALRFLVEFLSDGRRPWLSAVSAAPTRETQRLGTGDLADLWRLPGRDARPGLVLVHGLTPAGKDDARLAWAAALLARGGLAVLVPDLPAMRAQRLRPDDARVVAAAIARLAADPAVRPDRLAVVGVSVGLAPALLAAAEPTAGEHVRLVLSLGGHAEARELIRYFTTGAYGAAGFGGRLAVDPGLARGFLAANLDLVRDPADRAAVAAWLAGGPAPAAAGAEGQAVLAVLTNRDPARVDALLATLPPDTRALLDALSPARHATRFPGRLLLVHGREDPAVPFTESLRLLAAADPRQTRLVLVSLVGHVEGLGPAWSQLADLARLWSVVYELFRG